MKLKFRAWHKERERYYEVATINFYEEVVGLVLSISGEPDSLGKYYYHVGVEYVIFDDVTLEQYTGLKDKDGTEIYIGDIIEVDMYHGHRKRFIVDNRLSGDIGCNGGEYSFYITGIVPTNLDGMVDNYGGCEIAYDGLIKGEVDIVGNIHEDKELLK